MSVQESLMAPGQWSLKLRADTPRQVIDALGYFGHIAISIGRADPRTAGDQLLNFARYVGVLRGATYDDSGVVTVTGPGMAIWLGDEDKKGSVLETPQTFTAQTFPTVVRALLPPAVTEGTLYSVAGTYTGTHQWQSPREAIQYVCDTMGAEWRVNGNATLDAGPVANLYRTTPTAAIVKRDAGRDMTVTALPGTASLAEDVADYTTRVVLLAQGTGAATATGSADISPALNPYKDLHGNTLVRTRLVSESTTDGSNATARAQLALNQFTSPRDALTLNTSEYDIKGTLVAGDSVWVWDPDAQLVDTTNEIRIRGRIINPVKLRVQELTWPIARGMGVAYRDVNGTWYDLTDYVQWESGTTSVVVGGYNRSLVSTSEAVGGRPIPDASVPAAPVFGAFQSGTYQSDSTGHTKAFIQVNWSEPLNVDGSTITDGNYYEIRWRTSDTPIFPIRWQDLTAYTWADLAANTWAQPLTFSVERSWHYVQVAWGETSFNIHELTPAVTYDFQIRAIDSASPPNVGAFSAITSFAASVDVFPPATPAPPTVAGSRIAIQVTHTLGQAAGGTYNLDFDLHHFEIHASDTTSFTPADATLLGKLIANAGMINGGIPAVGTFQVESTGVLYVKVIAVDESGNKSLPSTPATVTALLVDDTHISDLTVSKVTAGTISADWILAGSIKTATTGTRLEADSSGLRLYDSLNNLTFNANASTGTVSTVGSLKTSLNSDGISILPSGGAFPHVIQFKHTTTATEYSAVTSYTYLDGSTALALQTQRSSDDLADGGAVVANTNYSKLTWIDHATQLEAFDVEVDDSGIYIGSSATSPDLGYLIINGSNGRWSTQGTLTAVATNEDLFCGDILTVGSGFSGITFVFTTSVQPIINATVYDTTGATTAYCDVSALGTSSATISYAGAHAVKVMYTMWNGN